MISLQTSDIDINVKDTPLSIKFDKLSICYNDPIKEHLHAPCNALISEHILTTAGSVASIKLLIARGLAASAASPLKRPFSTETK
jgi:hypothetical protein